MAIAKGDLAENCAKLSLSQLCNGSRSGLVMRNAFDPLMAIYG